MRVFSKAILRDFWKKHSSSEQQLKAWYKETENSSWKFPGDIKKEYPSASIVANNRVVFNINGNKYRLVVKINYQRGWVFVRFIGTHIDYDSIDVTTI